MESFMKAADDLDKLLDEFEKNEDLGKVKPPATLKSQPYIQPLHNGIDVSLENGKDEDTLNHSNQLDDCNSYENDLLIDLSEADFAPAPQSASLLASLTSGVLKPLNSGSNQDEQTPLGNDGFFKTHSDSNIQLAQQDFSSYLPTNLKKTVTLDELKGLDYHNNPNLSSPNKLKSDIFTSAAEPRHIQDFNIAHPNPILTNGFSQEDTSARPHLLVTTSKESVVSSANVDHVEKNLIGVQVERQIDIPPILTNGITTSPLKIKEIETENTNEESLKDNLNALDDLATLQERLLNPNLMETYIRQGARPKVPGAPVKMSDHSPQRKLSADNTSNMEEPNDKQDILATPTELPNGETHKPVGFGSTADISVSEADLDAFEVELDLTESEQPISDSVKDTTVTSTSNKLPSYPTNSDVNNGSGTIMTLIDNFEADRVGTLFRINNPLSEQDTNQSDVAANNKLMGLEPVLQSAQNNLPNGDVSNSLGPELKINADLESHRVPFGEADSSSTITQGGPQDAVAPVQPASQFLAQDTLQPVTGNGYLPVQNFFTLESQETAPEEENVPTQPQSVPVSQIYEEVQPIHNQHQLALEENRAVTNEITSNISGGSRVVSEVPRDIQSSPPSNVLLPPDPPSYQQVQEWKAAEFERNQGMPATREPLTLDFNQSSGQRHPSVQPLPPSPIVEEVGVTTGYVRDSSGHSRHQRPPADRLSASLNSQSQNVSTISQGGNDNNTIPPTQNGMAENMNDGGLETDDHVSESMMVDIGGIPVRLGDVAPVWMPDTEALNCMKCTLKFTFRKRRHHCRACGKVFCAKCCSVRVKLKYMKSREARVCNTCLNAILTAQAMQRVNNVIQSNENSPESSTTMDMDPHPNEEQTNDEEEEIIPDASIQRSRSVLRQPSIDGTERPRESRHVRFSDGIQAGSNKDEQEVSNVDNTEHRSERSSRKRLVRQRGSKSFIPESEGMLPPRLIACGIPGEFRIEENPNVEEVMQIIKNETAEPVLFQLSKILHIHVKIVQLKCCVNRTCWCFTTKGLATVGQDEIVFVLECLPEEVSVPRDMLLHIYNLYQNATKGSTVQHLGHSVFTHSFLGSRDHGGFLYLTPTYQCQQKLIIPEQPFLYGILLQKWELPWAKIFPLRLMLRLGAEYRYYPCPLMSVRFRKPVFGEIGHTIMNLLADFKNYQYMLPTIRGVVVHMQDHETVVHLPKNRYDDVMKVINNSNEHVMAIGANFSQAVDSHLVCIQNDQGVYQTQAINRQNKPRKVTGASFMVLNGALKSSSGLTAKSSIVEDGLMVQIRPEMMASLRDALRNMKDFTIPCGAIDGPRPDETVIMKWVENDTSFNIGVKSPVDGRSLEGVESIRIQNTTDFQGQNKIIRWTEVFFIENGSGGGEDAITKRHIPEPVDLSRLAENLAIAFCLALSENLQDLCILGLNKLALRVTVDLEKVGYEVGSRGNSLPDQYMNNLDDLLIPVLHNAVSQQEGDPVILELVFYILD